MNEAVTCRAPGKMILAGEYAVLTPAQPALVMAVDRYVTVTASRPRTSAVELVTDLIDHAVPLHRTTRGLRPCHDRDAPHLSGALTHLIAAIDTVDRFLDEVGRSPVPVRLTIRSTLHEQGTKIGLGSSGAVVVAAVQALTAFNRCPLNAETRFRLALLAGVRLNAHASGADLAASTWGGWVRYSPPDRHTLRQAAHADGVIATLRADWPGLSLRALPPPTSVTLHAGWTGRPASTTDMISRLHRTTWWDSEAHHLFRTLSARLVDELAHAVGEDDPDAIRTAIRTARRLLQKLDAQAALGIFTPALTALCDAAVEAGGAGKPSGAGGGDCGITLTPTAADPSVLHRHWARAGITPLPLRTAAATGPTKPPREIGPRADTDLAAHIASPPRTAP